MCLVKRKNKILVLIILLGSFYIASYSIALDTIAKSTNLTLELLKNAEYYVGSSNIRLKNGSYEKGSNVEGDYVSVNIREIAFGDINGDGEKDAAVILSEHGGGTGVFMILAVVINHGGNPHHIASAPLGDRVIIKSISIREKDIIIDMIKMGHMILIVVPHKGKS